MASNPFAPHGYSHEHPKLNGKTRCGATPLLTMTQPTIDLIACLGIAAAIGIPVLLLTAWLERPRRKPAKGRSVRLNRPIR